MGPIHCTGLRQGEARAGNRGVGSQQQQQLQVGTGQETRQPPSATSTAHTLAACQTATAAATAAASQHIVSSAYQTKHSPAPAQGLPAALAKDWVGQECEPLQLHQQRRVAHPRGLHRITCTEAGAKARPLRPAGRGGAPATQLACTAFACWAAGCNYHCPLAWRVGQRFKVDLLRREGRREVCCRG